MKKSDHFIESVLVRLKYYKALAEKTFDQLNERDFFFSPDKESNSIAIIVQHMAGNMISRWTDFLISDGEKEWRNRPTEFEETYSSGAELLEFWETGWQCCLQTIGELKTKDLSKTVYIRREALSVTEAIIRQLAHYPYHVGQIVYLGKMIKKEKWNSLSIPK